MQKNALGRGLGDLLAGQSASGRSEAGLGDKQKGRGELGPGLRVLVLQKTADETKANAPGLSAGSLAALKFSLAIGDLLMVTGAVIWQGSINRPLGIVEAAVLIGIVSFGAWLGCLAAWLQLRQH